MDQIDCKEELFQNSALEDAGNYNEKFLYLQQSSPFARFNSGPICTDSKEKPN
jgi:hypothetical protein